ncbi:MAG: hypothetical protein IJ120_12340 [Solobacterium sp.]|nr:hypothetical protein [Solobacterium sp.]
MNKLVYFYTPGGELVNRLLTEAGFEIVNGNGTVDHELLAKCDALVPGKGVFRRDLLEEAKNLKIISKFGVGMDRIDIDACTELGIWACNTPLVNYVAVSEHTAALLLAAAKRFLPVVSRVHREEPDWFGAHKFTSIELMGKTLALIGFGHIGQRVARLFSTFEMNIVAYDPFADDSAFPDYVTRVHTLDEAAACADFVSVHAAGEKSTEHLIDAHFLSLMKPTAILINTTRGFVVDEEALIKALQEKRIAGAALDVFNTEPVTGRNELMCMENVITTPHCAANTPEARLRSQRDAAANIIACFNGERPPFALNNPIGVSKSDKSDE